METGAKVDRDLKATKADDAAVPVWLWNDAVRAGLAQDPTARGHKEADIDRALERIRDFLLTRKFKVDATRSFFNFIHEEYPDLATPERSCVQWNGKRFGWLERGGRPVGRKLYRGWWQGYWVGMASAELFPGWDAIHRTSESTW
jgi:hypothetical protein